MIIKAKVEELFAALHKINKEKYSENITMIHFPLNKKGTRFRVRLSVADSKKPGARRGMPDNGKPGRRIKAACWHTHGHFFDALLEYNPDIIIRAGALKIYQDKGVNGQGGRYNNWQDRNIGSMLHPFYFSEACDCGA
jgi:hypothetical protein